MDESTGGGKKKSEKKNEKKSSKKEKEKEKESLAAMRKSQSFTTADEINKMMVRFLYNK